MPAGDKLREKAQKARARVAELNQEISDEQAAVTDLNREIYDLEWQAKQADNAEYEGQKAIEDANSVS